MRNTVTYPHFGHEKRWQLIWSPTRTPNNILGELHQLNGLAWPTDPPKPLNNKNVTQVNTPTDSSTAKINVLKMQSIHSFSVSRRKLYKRHVSEWGSNTGHSGCSGGGAAEHSCLGAAPQAVGGSSSHSGCKTKSTILKIAVWDYLYITAMKWRIKKLKSWNEGYKETV